MGYWDLIANQISTYRQNILFNIDNDEPLVNVGLVKVYFDILPNWLKVKGLSLTEEPSKPIMDLGTSADKRTSKFSSTYLQEQLTWVLDNLKICEEGFSKHLYQRKQMFEILQVAMQMYRQSVLFQLQKNREPFIEMNLVEIMNVLLPESFRAKYPDKPKSEGMLMFSDHLKAEQIRWTLTALDEVEKATARYITTQMLSSQH